MGRHSVKCVAHGRQISDRLHNDRSSLVLQKTPGTCQVVTYPLYASGGLTGTQSGPSEQVGDMEGIL